MIQSRGDLLWRAHTASSMVGVRTQLINKGVINMPCILDLSFEVFSDTLRYARQPIHDDDTEFIQHTTCDENRTDGSPVPMGIRQKSVSSNRQYCR